MKTVICNFIYSRTFNKCFLNIELYCSWYAGKWTPNINRLYVHPHSYNCSNEIAVCLCSIRNQRHARRDYVSELYDRHLNPTCQNKVWFYHVILTSCKVVALWSWRTPNVWSDEWHGLQMTFNTFNPRQTYSYVIPRIKIIIFLLNVCPGAKLWFIWCLVTKGRQANAGYVFYTDMCHSAFMC